MTPMVLIEKAMSSGAGIEQLEKLLELQIRHEQNEARKAYAAALSAFASEGVKIAKDKRVNFSSQRGTTDYRHATLGAVVDALIPALARHGLSHSWRTAQAGSEITVTCRLSHCLGHYEEVSLSGAPDDSGNKNKIQQVGSTVTYLQRYTLLAITGMATHEQDDDAKAAGQAATPVEYVTEDQAHNIAALIAEVKADLRQFCGFFRIDGVDLLPASQYSKAVAMLEAKRGK